MKSRKHHANLKFSECGNTESKLKKGIYYGHKSQ